MILVGALIQSRRLACSAQKPSGSFTERSYIARYLAASQKARSAHSAGTANTSDISALPVALDASTLRRGSPATLEVVSTTAGR